MKYKIIIGIAVLILVAVIYFIRPDAGRHWAIQQIYQSSRWYYVPCIAAMLYIFDYLLPQLDGRLNKQPGRLVSNRSKLQRLAKHKNS